MATTIDKVPAHVKAHATGRWAETLFRALSTRVADRWKFVSFRGKNKAEWRGVVDLIAIRKSTAQPDSDVLKRGDLFELVLIQLKGGSAPAPRHEDLQRLREVQRRHRAKAVVLFQWRKARTAEFFLLDRNLQWVPSSSKEIFG
jgi:hypothetical protein